MSFGGGSGGSGSIHASTDVALNNPADGQVLSYNNNLSKWQNVTLSLAQQESVNTVSTSGAAQTLPDVTAATIQYVTLTANCTFTFPAAAAGKSFMVVLMQDATGSRLVSWPASVQWPGTLAPTLTIAAGKKDAFSFVCVDGTNWLGLTVGQNF